MCALIVKNGKGVDVLFMDGGKVPLWDYYTDAYDYAHDHKLDAVAYEFRSLSHAQSMFGNIFTEGDHSASSYTTRRAADHCGRQHCDYSCLAA